MRGHTVYFYMLKDDLIESFKRVEEKFGGLQYALGTAYNEPKLKIYNSIEEISDIGIIKPISRDFYIALKDEKFTIRSRGEKNGVYSYFYVGDELGFLQFIPSGLYENTNCIIGGRIGTVAESETRLLLFKELKKSLLKNSMKRSKGIEYVGKSVIENKEKYRIPYGSPSSPPEYDRDISDMVWIEKGRKKKI